MKRILLLALLMIVGLCAAASAAPAPASNQSFTYAATAGMFEDVYDYFVASPAYLPTFKRNTFWGQLANLYNHADHAFGDTPLVFEESNSTYQLGGQMNTPFGRAGLSLFWYANEQSVRDQFYNESGFHYGFGEGTTVEYRDTDANGDMDFRIDTYGKSEKTDRGSNLRIYAVYALPAFAGFDLGAAVRLWNSNSSPTYYERNPLGTNKASFNEAASVKQYDYTLWNPLVYSFEDSTNGSWNYGWTDLRATLGGRTKGLLPGIELVGNLTPVLRLYGNDLKWNYTSYTNYAAADPAHPHDVSSGYAISGSGGTDWNSTAPRKAAGYGAAGDVRGDMTLMPGVLLTGWLGFETVGWNSKDGKLETLHSSRARNTVASPPSTNLETTSVNSETSEKWEDKGYDSQATAKVRLQFPAKGWKLGLGLAASVRDQKNEASVVTVDNSTTRFETTTGVPFDSYTDTSNSGNKTIYTSQVIEDTIELPVGMVIDLLTNLNLQLGAKHTITWATSNYRYSVPDLTLYTATRTRDDGTRNSTTPTPQASAAAYSRSSYDMSHSSAMYYGLTWWAYENLQIDVTGFNTLTGLSNYNLSVNLYF